MNEKRQSKHTKAKMSQMLESAGKDVRAAIIKMFQQ